jgi:hypothetical protein
MKNCCYILLILLSNYCHGQHKAAVYNRLQSFMAADFLNSGQMDTVKWLLKKRDRHYIKNKLDTSKATLVILVESYRFSTKEYGIREEYYYDSTLVTYWLNRKQYFYHTVYLKSAYDQFDTLKNSVNYFQTPGIIVFSLDIPDSSNLNDNLKNKKKRPSKSKSNREDYFNLVTYIDNSRPHIAVRLDLPEGGIRTVPAEPMNRHLIKTRTWL